MPQIEACSERISQWNNKEVSDDVVQGRELRMGPVDRGECCYRRAPTVFSRPDTLLQTLEQLQELVEIDLLVPILIRFLDGVHQLLLVHTLTNAP